MWYVDFVDDHVVAKFNIHIPITESKKSNDDYKCMGNTRMV